MTRIPAPDLIEELRQHSLIDDAAGFVLADKLQEMGDPCGEFLSLDYHLKHDDLSPEQRSAYSLHRQELYPQFFHIESLPDCFRLHNVFYDHWFYTVDQSKELLDGGRNRTQDGWNEWLQSKENKEKWQLASGLVYHASLAALHYNQDHPDKKQRKLIKQCREMHAKDFKDYWMMTSTKIIYTSQGLDTIIHDYGFSHQQEMELNLVGPSGDITTESGLEEEMRALLGTSDLREVKTVYHDLTGRKPYLWRVNNMPNEEVHRALVLGVDGIYDGFDINADNFIDDDGPGRGVVVSSGR